MGIGAVQKTVSIGIAKNFALIKPNAIALHESIIKTKGCNSLAAMRNQGNQGHIPICLWHRTLEQSDCTLHFLLHLIIHGNPSS